MLKLPQRFCDVSTFPLHINSAAVNVCMCLKIGASP